MLLPAGVMKRLLWLQPLAASEPLHEHPALPVSPGGAGKPYPTGIGAGNGSFPPPPPLGMGVLRWTPLPGPRGD